MKELAVRARKSDVHGIRSPKALVSDSQIVLYIVKDNEPIFLRVASVFCDEVFECFPSALRVFTMVASRAMIPMRERWSMRSIGADVEKAKRPTDGGRSRASLFLQNNREDSG